MKLAIHYPYKHYNDSINWLNLWSASCWARSVNFHGPWHAIPGSTGSVPAQPAGTVSLAAQGRNQEIFLGGHEKKKNINFPLQKVIFSNHFFFPCACVCLQRGGAQSEKPIYPVQSDWTICLWITRDKTKCKTHLYHSYLHALAEFPRERWEDFDWDQSTPCHGRHTLCHRQKMKQKEGTNDERPHL